MTGDFAILRLFLIKIVYSHANMVNGLSERKDTGWGTECLFCLAVKAAAFGYGLSNRLPLFPLLSWLCLADCPGWAQTPNAPASVCRGLPSIPTTPGFPFHCFGGGKVIKAQVKRMLRGLTVDKSLLVESQETHVRSTCELVWKAEPV